MRTHPFVSRRQLRAALVFGVVLSLPLGYTAARQIANSPGSPALGHAQVVTQGIAELPNEQMVWRVVERTAQPRWEARPGRRVLGFVLASDEPILLTGVEADGATEDIARLGPGEALLVRDGDRQIRASMTDAPVSYLSLEFVPAADADEVGNGTVLYVSDPLAPPPGARDLDLVRNVLAMDETATIPDTGNASYILATDGAIDVLPSNGGRMTLQAGESAIVDGEVQIRAIAPAAAEAVAAARLTVNLYQDGARGAGYVVAVIGEEIGPVQTPTPVPTETPTVAPPTATVPPPVEPTPEPTMPPDPTTPPEPTVPPRADMDGDGIPDEDEPQFGTSPRLSDTDGDGVLDGDEAFVYGTNPTLSDSDADALGDGDEIFKIGTEPLVRDTDGDGITDGREVASGRDPLDPEA